jgi:hypothetical protein
MVPVPECATCAVTFGDDAVPNDRTMRDAGEVRKAWNFYVDSLANETSARFGALTGVWWVLSSGVSMRILMGAQSGVAIRPAFYVIAASTIPVLLFTYLNEHFTMMTSIAKRNKRPKELIDRAAQLTGDDALPEELLAPLRASTSSAEHLLVTGYASAARIAAMGASGWIIAVVVIATGASTTFSLAAVSVGFLATGLAAVQFKVARFRWPYSEIDLTH